MSTKRESDGFIAETLKVIEDTLNQVTEDLKAENSYTEWTREIKNRLCKVGRVCEVSKERKYWVYASCCDAADGTEWLYDLTWLDCKEANLTWRDSKGLHVRDVKLALESEWGNEGEINDDFQKLLLVRADLRCMIFSTQTKGCATEKAKAKIEDLITQVKQFSKSQDGDTYLFCAWLYGEDRFLFCDYTHDG